MHAVLNQKAVGTLAVASSHFCLLKGGAGHGPPDYLCILWQGRLVDNTRITINCRREVNRSYNVVPGKGGKDTMMGPGGHNLPAPRPLLRVGGCENDVRRMPAKSVMAGVLCL